MKKNAKQYNIDPDRTVVLYPDGKHGWFRYGRADGSPFHETMTEVEEFLTKLNYLKSE